MTFAADIRAKLLDGPTTGTTAKGLELVEERVTLVIKAIDLQLTDFKPKEFETAGEIREASFGAADRSSLLALHHRRAHAVTAATLTGVKQDLEAFRQACTDARMLIQEADRRVADEVVLTRRAVDRLLEGSESDHGSTANDQAQQNAAGSEPAAGTTPVGDTTGATTDDDTSGDTA